MAEARVTINGVELSEAQSIVVRVAVSGMLHDLNEPEYLKSLGEIGPHYQARLSEVQEFIFRSVP